MKLPPCPNATVFRPSCKRRGCSTCGVRWARDWLRVMRVNLEAFGRPLALVTITAPGADRLPWDRERCTHGPRARCSGSRYGCRVQDRALREWGDTATLRLAWLRRAAYQATKRAGHAPPAWLERVWEPQKRGAPHVHVVVPFGTPAERAAAERYVAELRRLAPEYDFGFVDAHLKAHTADEAARYLASYLTGRTRRKGSIRENIADPRLPRSLIWLTPKLTRVTFVTMRSLRRARHLWAALDGLCEPPSWVDAAEAVKIGIAFRRAYPTRAGPADVDEAAAFALAATVERRADELEEIDNGFARIKVPVRITGRYRLGLFNLAASIARPLEVAA